MAMSLSKEQKDRLFSLIHEVMDKNSELEKVCDECGPFNTDEYEELCKDFDDKEQELIDYINSL